MESQTNQLTNLPVLQVVLHKNYETVKTFCVWLAKNVSGYLVGEHPADEEIKTTHCHIQVEGLKVTVEAMRKEIQKVSGGRGQYVIMSVTQKTRVKYDRDQLATYIIKGNEDHVKETSYTTFEVADWCGRWVDKKATNHEEDKSKTIYDIILKVYKEQAKEWKLDNNNALQLHIEPSRFNFHILCSELNKARIRTSRNELERAWVTLLRQSDLNQGELFDSINANVFRKNF